MICHLNFIFHSIQWTHILLSLFDDHHYLPIFLHTTPEHVKEVTFFFCRREKKILDGHEQRRRTEDSPDIMSL